MSYPTTIQAATRLGQRDARARRPLNVAVGDHTPAAIFYAYVRAYRAQREYQADATIGTRLGLS